MKVQITDVEQRRTGLAPKGTPPYVYEIFYKTDTGMSGSIEMFHSEYSPENALKKIQEEIVPKAAMIGKTFEVK